MNFNLYIFGENKGTYNQYPNDYTSSILSAVCADVQSSNAFIIRDHNLMHYIYVENLGHSNILGVCLIFNNAYIKHVSKIFNFLRGLIESTLLKQAKIIRYNDQGNIEFTTSNIRDDIKSFDFVKTLVNSKLDSNNNFFGVAELTTTYNGLHNSVTIEGNTANSEIIKLQEKYNKIIIDYNKGIEEDSTKKIISGLQIQLSYLNKDLDSKKQEIRRLEKQKKQYKKIVALFIVLLCCCGCLYFLYAKLDKANQYLNDTTRSLVRANDSIASLNTVLTQQQNSIISLKNEVRDERLLKEAAQSKLDNIQSHCPIIITGTSCSLSSGEYTIRYYAQENGSRSFRIKVIEEKSGRIYTQKSVSEDIDSGTGSFTVYLNRSFNTSDWYTFEIWDGNRILGGSRH